MSEDPFADFEVLGELAYGYDSLVLKIHDRRLDRVCALKVSMPEPDPNHVARTRPLRAARIQAVVQHPNVVQLYAVSENEGRIFFLMELVEGGNLAQKLDGKPWAPDQAVAIIAALAGAVHAVHRQGLVHRDINPWHILLTTDGQPKLTGFRFARPIETTGQARSTGIVFGVPGYLSPEQALDKQDEVGPASDIWALGVVLFQLLTGRLPFQGKSRVDTLRQTVEGDLEFPNQCPPGICPKLEAICVKCLEKLPHHRYSTAAALAEDLRCS